MKNFGELVSEVRQEPTALEEGKKPNSMGPGWMLKADPKLGKAVADAVAKAKEKRRLVGSKTEPVKEDVEQLDEMPGANMDTRAVHQHLKKQGWKLTRTSGSHDVFTHPEAKHHIPVPRHRQLKAPLVKGILKQASVNEETDTTEKTEMAQTQLHFIKYAAEEILEYIGMGGEIEEWYQNKLSKVQSDVESLHSYVEGESRRTGMKEEVDPAHKKILDRAKTSTPKSPKGEYDRKVEKYLKKKYTKEEVELDEAGMSPQQKMDFSRHMVGAMSRDAYAKKWKLGKYREKSTKYKLDPTGVYHNLIKTVAKEEVEQIDELSKDTVQSYVGKAKTNYATQRKRMSRAYYQDVDKYDDATVKSDARKAGIKAAKARLAKEEVEQIDEISDKTLQSYRAKAHTQIQHFKHAGGKDKPEASSVLAKREPGMATATAKVIQKNKERIAAQPKREPQKISSYKPLGGRDDNSGRSYSESVEQYDEAVKQTKNSDVPFDGPYVNKATKTVKDKSGAVHTPMSRVKHLAKMAARKQAGLKEEEEKEDSYEKTNTPAKRSLSKNAGMVKDLAKNGKSSKKAAPEAFQSEPELSSQIVKV